ncbi:hypothetical protein D3C71_1723660 [compost metagenome]
MNTNYEETAGGNKVNTSQEISETKNVDDLKIEQGKLVYENGTSKLTSKVTNNGESRENLIFDVKFIANDGTVIATSKGLVGDIKANEVKYIESNITLDVVGAKDVVYEVVK